jgi:hypothetical protein
MFDKILDSQLSAAERHAFTKLTERLGFTPHVIFGFDGGVRDVAERYDNGKVGGRHLVYALTAADPTRSQEARAGVLEYRLLIAVVSGERNGKTPQASGSDEVLLNARYGKRRMTRSALHRASKKAWRTRVRRYGPSGRKPEAPVGL